jgi:hypothetical protein
MSVESAACQKKRSEAMRLYEFKIIYRTTFADFHRAGPLLVQLRAVTRDVGGSRRGQIGELRRDADEQAYRVLHRQSLQFTGC